ncbi:MAG: MFS transporter [Dehalococcoidia bacterium]|nr:MFS transporter [Dehalococcoidia bacterium]
MRANIWKFALFRFLVNFQLWLPIWVVYLTDYRGLSLTEVTVLDSAFWVLLVFMEVPTGVVADRWGRKLSLSCGAAANAVAVLVFGVADSYPLILASYLAWGVAWTLFSGADAAFFFDTLRALGREDEYQKLWGRTWAIQSAGVLAGLLLGAPLAHQTNLMIPIVLSAALMGLAWAVSLSFHEPPHHGDAPPGGYLAGVRSAAATVWRSQPLRYMMFLAAVVVACAMCLSILTQPFLDAHGVGVGQFGWFLVPGNLLGIVTALFAYRVTGALGVNRVIAIMPLAVMGVAAALGAWNSLGAFVFYPLNSAVYAFSFPVVSDYLNKRISSHQRATILSIYQLLFSLVLAPLEPLFGVVGDGWGLPAAYRVLALSVAIGAAPLLALWLRASRAERLEAEPIAEPATGG